MNALAVLGDIHSNHVALNACVQDAVAHGATGFVILGDLVSDCTCPGETLAGLDALEQQYPCWIVRGNREDYLREYRADGETGWRKGSSAGSLLYTYERLTHAQRDWLDGLPLTIRIKRAGLPSLLCCHGSPVNTRELLRIGGENSRQFLCGMQDDVLLCAHTHVQGTYEVQGRKLINPGAVGMPMRYGGMAQYALLQPSPGGWREQYMQLEYDRERVYAEFEREPLREMAPVWAAIVLETLRTGRDDTSKVLRRAMQLSREETGNAEWSTLAEKYWEQAALETGIPLK